jgi:hypothetical protein
MAMYAMAAGVALQVLGTISDANSQAGQFKAEAAAERRNASILDSKALQVGAEGARNEEQIRREFRQVIGRQLAGAGEGGFSAAGSSLDIIQQSEARGALDAANVQYQAQSEARGYRTEASNARARSVISAQLAKRAKLAGYLKGAGQVAAGASMMGGGGSALGAGSGKGLYSVNYTGGVSRGMA